MHASTVPALRPSRRDGVEARHSLDRGDHLHRGDPQAPRRYDDPYYVVDAVVDAPFGCYPGTVPGLYRADLEHLMEFGVAQMQGKMDAYLEKWVHSVSSHTEMMEKRVGFKKMQTLRSEETHTEGYYT